jgi:adenylylsulfate kinase-like enzyme
MSKLDPVVIIIKGKHNTGKTSLANIIKGALQESGYRHVELKDTAPLPYDEKDRFEERFERNRELRAVSIRVELEAE